MTKLNIMLEKQTVQVFLIIVLSFVYQVIPRFVVTSINKMEEIIDYLRVMMHILLK